MPLVTSKEMFEKAYKGGYAIGAFNVNNMEIIQSITEAAAELKAPLILSKNLMRSIWIIFSLLRQFDRSLFFHFVLL